MPKLTQVKETKRGRYALFFDGEFAFSLDEDTFAMAGLHTGDELEEWQIHDLQTKSDTRKAVDKAMDLLALRDHAAGELYQKLCRSFDPHSAAAAVAKMHELNLLDYAGFSEYGTNILAAFDLNVPAEGDRSELKPVLPMSALADFCAANNVSIGIVTVPKEAAQAVTDVLYRSGVRAFWCFAPCRLQLPPDAVIQYENLALSLAHLKARL